MEIEILSKMFIKPSTPTLPQNQTYNLGFLDQLSVQFHMPTIFLYPFNPTITSAMLLERLKESLSETLSLYLPLAGRFNEDGLSISCQDQGVVFLEARCNGQLSKFLPKAHNDLSLLFDFFQKDIGDVKVVRTPMLSIQVTTFECGALALATYLSHALADQVSAATFIHHWSTISRFYGNNVSEIGLQYFQTANLFPLNILGNNNIPRLIFNDNDRSAAAVAAPAKITKIIRKVFFINADAISTLKAKVVAANEYPSRLAMVVGTIWKALISISQAKHGYLRPSTLSLTFNLRGRTPLIPKNSFGNSYLHFPIKFSANNDQVELRYLVGLVGDAIKNTALAVSRASTKEEMALLSATLHNQIMDDKNNASIDVHVFTSWCKFPFSDMDFGWGKPIWLGTCIKLKCVVLTDTICGTGIEAKVGLDESDMLEFEGDSNVKNLHFASSLDD